MASFFRDGCCRPGESAAARRERVDSQLEEEDSSNAAEDGDGRDDQVDDTAASALKLVFHAFDGEVGLGTGDAQDVGELHCGWHA